MFCCWLWKMPEEGRDLSFDGASLSGSQGSPRIGVEDLHDTGSISSRVTLLRRLTTGPGRSPDCKGVTGTQALRKGNRSTGSGRRTGERRSKQTQWDLFGVGPERRIISRFGAVLREAARSDIGLVARDCGASRAKARACCCSNSIARRRSASEERPHAGPSSRATARASMRNRTPIGIPFGSRSASAAKRSAQNRVKERWRMAER